MTAESIGKWIVVAGVVLALLGAAVWALAKIGLPLGHLPGDVHIRGKHTSVSFPIVTMIILSIVLTIVLNVLSRIFRKGP